MKGARAAIAAGMVVAAVGAAGCSGLYVRPPEARESAYEEDGVTGSNLPRRRTSDAGVRQANKDAVASEIRTQTRNTGQ